MSDQSQFDDLPDGYGALGGGAAEGLDRVTTKVVPTGIESTISCWNCGKKNLIGCDWREVITASIGYLPPNWDLDKKTNTLFPVLGCAGGGCNRQIKIGFTPQELTRCVAAGIEQGYITQPQVDQFKAQVRQAAGHAPGPAQGGLARR